MKTKQEQYAEKKECATRAMARNKKELATINHLEALGLECPRLIVKSTNTICYEVKTFEEATGIFNHFGTVTDVIDCVHLKKDGYRASVHPETNPNIGRSNYTVLDDSFNVYLSTKFSIGRQDDSELRFFIRSRTNDYMNIHAIYEIHVKFEQRIASIETKHQHSGKTSQSSVIQYNYEYHGADIGMIPLHGFTSRDSFNTPEFLEFMMVDEPSDWVNLIHQVKVNRER